MSQLDQRAVVINSGSETTRMGFSGDGEPCHVIPTCVSFQKDDKTYFKKPIENGMITNWELLETFWLQLFNEHLKLPADGQPLLMTESPSMICLPRFRECVAQLIFETFGVRDFYLACESVMSLLASGKTSGMVLSSGGMISHISPIYEGICIRNGIRDHKVSCGDELTSHLITQLKEKGADISSRSAIIAVQQAKEKFCRVALDFKEDVMKTNLEICQFELPDGSVITLDKEITKTPEIIFNPQLHDEYSNRNGIQSIVGESISRIDPELKDEFLQNIILSGGNTLFQGFPQRLENELSTLHTSPILIHSPERRIESDWRGGSIFASLSTFKNHTIAISDYDDIGPNIINRKCF